MQSNSEFHIPVNVDMDTIQEDIDFVLNTDCDNKQEMENTIIEEVDKIILLEEQCLVLENSSDKEVIEVNNHLQQEALSNDTDFRSILSAAEDL